MSSSASYEGNALERKILDLEARLRAENEAKEHNLNLGNLNSTFTPRRPNQISRPNQLLSGGSPLPPRHEGTPTRSRKELALPLSFPAARRHQETAEIDNKMQEIMKMNGLITINNTKYQTEQGQLDHLGELGNGTCGHVVKMLHRPSNAVIAVKQMRRSGNSDENKRIIMDIDVVLKSHDCPYIVQCLGCFITDADVWICMELMATCFDKLLRRLRRPIPEDILGKVTVATVKALHYLKESHGVIHRDVKPSNILLDERGNVKLCDFGISGRLVDSKAKTRSAGCAAYMAPERIDPPDPTKPDYDIRADVWSLGITLVELATGRFPYHDCKTDFEVLTKVLQDAPPVLPKDSTFGPEFRNFVDSCLTKNYRHRPKYRKLLEHPFIRKAESTPVDVAEWFAQALKQTEPQQPPQQQQQASVSTMSVGTNTSSAAVTQATASNSLGQLRRFTPPPLAPQASPTPPRRHGTFNQAQFQPSNHQRHTSVPEPLPLGVVAASSVEAAKKGVTVVHPTAHALMHHAQQGGQGGGGGHPQHLLHHHASPAPLPPRPHEHLAYRPPVESRLQDGAGGHGVPPPPPQRTFPPTGEHAAAAHRKRHPSEPPHPTANGGGGFFHRSYAFSPPPLGGRPTSPLIRQDCSTTSPSTASEHHHPEDLIITSPPSGTTPGTQKRFATYLNLQLQRRPPPSTSPQTAPCGGGGPQPPPQFNLMGGGVGGSPFRGGGVERYYIEGSAGTYYPTCGPRFDLQSHAPLTVPPSPPPRLSRGQYPSASLPPDCSSPRQLRRGYLDPTRRSLGANEGLGGCGSPSLSRRYVSPTPPTPPPRRLSSEGSCSVPGSPMHQRSASAAPVLRTRYHYTPEPQRRTFGTSGLASDLPPDLL